MENYKDLYLKALKKLEDLNKKIEEFQKIQQDWEIQKDNLQEDLEKSKDQFKRQESWQREQSKLQLELNSQLQKISENNKKLQQVSQDLEDKEKESNTLLDKIRNFYEGEESDEITEDGKKKRSGGMKDKLTKLEEDIVAVKKIKQERIYQEYLKSKLINIKNIPILLRGGLIDQLSS